MIAEVLTFRRLPPVPSPRCSWCGLAFVAAAKRLGPERFCSYTCAYRAHPEWARRGKYSPANPAPAEVDD